MTVEFNYFSDSDKALEYVGKRVDNGSKLEVIAAERVTCKKDFEARAKMRPDLALNMMVFTLTFNEEDDCEIYDGRHYLLVNWMHFLAESGVCFSQFVITCHETGSSKHEYNVIASLIDHAGRNVDIRDLSDSIKTAYMIFAEMNELDEEDCEVTGHELDLPLSLPDAPCTSLVYGPNNPLCHELVLPFRDGILANLKKILFDY